MNRAARFAAAFMCLAAVAQAGPAAPLAGLDHIQIAVKDLDSPTAARLEIPKTFHGVLVTKVEPLGPSFDAGIERNTLIMEVNRKPVESANEYRKIARATHPGDVLALYLYYPDLDQRRLVTVRVDR